MLFLVLVTQVVLCVHARSYDNVFDVEKMIEKVDSKEYESFYNGEFATREIGEIEKTLCHDGVRSRKGRLCDAYTTPITSTAYPSLNDSCLNVTWSYVNTQKYNPLAQQGYGNCVETSLDDEYRYVVSNSVPPYYMNPYCPFGLNNGYCIEGEPCPFPDIVCGVTTSAGFTTHGDVWVAAKANFKIPREGNPTLQDRPAEMYATVGDGEKNIGPSIGVHVNGINIQGPNDAGAVNVDEAGFQLVCGGHVTPPVNANQPPLYHYHKAADCTWCSSVMFEREAREYLLFYSITLSTHGHQHSNTMPIVSLAHGISLECTLEHQRSNTGTPAFKNESIPVSHGGKPAVHANLTGYANDGFGIYAFSDVGGSAPVLDECGGHFGPVNDDDPDSVVYHYHATTYTPYHLACQGPALQKCESTQHGTSFCGPGCGGYDVCVQPGTSKSSLKTYVAKWNSTWLDSYTVNDF